MKKHSCICLVGVLSLASAPGCSHDAPPPAEPSVAPAARTDQPVEDQLSTAYIQVDESIRTTCNLPNDEEKAPKFDYDEAVLKPRGEGILDGVAECLIDGPMQGESVTVIGHADPRGSHEYNLRLGRQRAQAASDYLAAHSVDVSRIRVESRGEDAALGDDEVGWSRDRRVEVRRGSVAP